MTRKAGIRFKHENGAIGRAYYPETFGSGVCVIDYNADGWQDLIFINGNRFIGLSHEGRDSVKEAEGVFLYRNNGDGTFSNKTHEAGLHSDLYGMGCSVGDYDNDGFQDLFVTGYGGKRLFHNEKGERFKDVTQKAGLEHIEIGSIDNKDPDPKPNKEWSSSSLWFDFDRDGDLDLFVGHYVHWTPETDLWCTIDGKEKSFCGPEPYPGESNRLFKNMGDGTFIDVTRNSGLYNPKGKALGVALCDIDEDGWLDLMVANDMVPNFLYRNNGDGSFRNEAVIRGLSAGQRGVSKAGMGVDVADFENNSGLGVLIGNFAHERLSFYVRKKEGLFLDESNQRGLGIPSHYFLTFGLFFFDYDLDGLKDVFAANGHVDPKGPLISRGSSYRQRPLLYLQQEGGNFIERGKKHGKDLSQAVLGRGAAYLDFDNDGDLDVVITDNGAEAILYRNDGGNQNKWLRVTLWGKENNRDGIGSIVRVKIGERILQARVKSGSSYLSQSELPLTFGLGKNNKVEWMEVHWSLGGVDRIGGVEGNQHIVIQEEKGIVKKNRFPLN